MIAKYIERHYPEFAGCDISIGRCGNLYRITVLDGLYCLHTIRVESADIDK